MFRFTIRDVLWLTVVVAMGIGWFLDRRQQEWRIDTQNRSAQIASDLREACIKHGWTVEIHHGEVFLAYPPGHPPPMSGPLPLPRIDP